MKESYNLCMPSAYTAEQDNGSKSEYHSLQDIFAIYPFGDAGLQKDARRDLEW